MLRIPVFVVFRSLPTVKQHETEVLRSLQAGHSGTLHTGRRYCDACFLHECVGGAFLCLCFVFFIYFDTSRLEPDIVAVAVLGDNGKNLAPTFPS
jgi:hypothetical protein